MDSLYNPERSGRTAQQTPRLERSKQDNHHLVYNSFFASELIARLRSALRQSWFPKAKVRQRQWVWSAHGTPTLLRSGAGTLLWCAGGSSLGLKVYVIRGPPFNSALAVPMHCLRLSHLICKTQCRPTNQERGTSYITTAIKRRLTLYLAHFSFRHFNFTR